MAKSVHDLFRKTMTPTAIGRAKARAHELLVEMLLSEVRKSRGKTQAETADAMGIEQPSLSKLERQGDMLLSTLRGIVRAYGGELEIAVKFPKEKRRVRLKQFDGAAT